MSEWRILDETGASFEKRFLARHEAMHRLFNWHSPRVANNLDAQLAEINRLRWDLAVGSSLLSRPAKGE